MGDIMFIVNKEECLGCGICVESCSKGAITMEGDKAVINQALCKQCGECRDICGAQAIEEV
jgi:ferredoxin